MTTRADLRSRVRAELNDTGAAQLWGDANLNQWLAEGIRAWSLDAPAARSTTLSSVKDQPAYALPSDLIQVLRVEHPAGYFRAPVPFAGGDVTPTSGQPSVDGCQLRALELVYEVFAGQLVLTPAPAAAGEAIVVRYAGSYLVPSSDATALDLPGADEDPVVWYACARALRWIAVDEAKRQRFERDRGADPYEIQRGYERMVRDALERRRGRDVSRRRLVVRGEG